MKMIEGFAGLSPYFWSPMFRALFVLTIVGAVMLLLPAFRTKQGLRATGFVICTLTVSLGLYAGVIPGVLLALPVALVWQWRVHYDKQQAKKFIQKNERLWSS